MCHNYNICQSVFQSTPSSRRATGNPRFICSIMPISIHALLAEGDVSSIGSVIESTTISIHALLAEGDATESGILADIPDISIHALLAEGDLRL